MAAIDWEHFRELMWNNADCKYCPMYQVERGTGYTDCLLLMSSDDKMLTSCPDYHKIEFIYHHEGE